jgi:hypothetical protein
MTDNASAICFETLLQSRQKSSSHIPHVTAGLLSDIVASHFGHALLPTLCLFSSLLGNGVELIKFDAIFFSLFIPLLKYLPLSFKQVYPVLDL